MKGQMDYLLVSNPKSHPIRDQLCPFASFHLLPQEGVVKLLGKKRKATNQRSKSKET